MHNKFGVRLKELRLEAGLSQKALGDKLGFSQTCLAKWEIGTNEACFDDLIKIADYFGVTTDFLLGRED